MRQRLGVRAPRLSIRRYVPWYWRALGFVAALVLGLALVVGLYGYGGSVAGLSGAGADREIELLRERVSALDAELVVLRRQAGSEQSSLEMERATQRKLAMQVKSLEVENAALKEDLSFFEGLMPASEAGKELLRIDNLRVAPTGFEGEYRYRMIVVKTRGKQPLEFKGRLEFAAEVVRDGISAKITLPGSSAKGLDGLSFQIKNFHRIEGVLILPVGSEVKAIEARLLQDGSVRARQSVVL